MRIVLLGYGKMGKEIEKIAIDRKHEIVLKVDETNANTITKEDLKKGDVAIEFSTPHTVVNNIYKCLDAQLPIVVGTTGWYEQFEKIKNDCASKKSSLFYATNFSIGVNLFFKVNKYLAELMNNYPDYNVSMEEIHHTEKKDAPSGTAVKTAEVILNELHRKNNWTLNSKASELDLLIVAKREPNVPGTHTVSYKSNVDCIQITHEAYNRKGFAEGAIMAANWLYGRQGVFQMSDMLNEL